jgi:P-type E1-E2 ATPase
VSSTLAVALSLVGSSPAALTARVVLVIIASGSFVVHTLTPGRDPSEPHPFGLTLAPLGAGAVALVARVLGHPEAGPSTNVAGVLVGTLAAGVWLVQRARKPVDTELDHIAQSLACGGHRVVGEEIAETSSHDLRPGEEIVLDEGEVVPVDATVVAGTAKVLPWLGAKTAATRGEGDAVVAGAHVLEGRLRAIVGWAGTDRAWMRLTSDPRRRADIHASLARLGRHLAERGSVILAGIAALAAFSSDRDPLVIAEFAVVAHASLANAPVALVAALHVAHTVLAALRRGIAFRTAEAFDRAGRASAAVFCARGTLLLGEPEVASIEPIGPHTAEVVLSLLAGAESGSSHPTAIAIQRAARARGVRADGVRSPTVLPGLGVTAVASTGQPLVVGSRGLMLKERISVALAESRIVDLEAMGRSVMLVALGGKLVGAVGLQDGLRPGARAAVQHLLDVGVEPILLSGDARETCEALGRAVDIEHIRPEVLPAERGEEIRRLADGGAVVAVLGQSPVDDAALSAADVSVALNSAGASSAEWHVQLASDDVRDAAFSLRLAHACRWRARASLTIAAAPGVVAATLMAIGVAPPAVVPLVALTGGVAAVFRLRTRG